MFHTLSQTEYLTRMFGPIMPIAATVRVVIDVPTPDESRALSEISRFRRMHSSIIEARCLSVSSDGRFMMTDVRRSLDDNAMTCRIAVTGAVRTVRQERVRRGRT